MLAQTTSRPHIRPVMEQAPIRIALIDNFPLLRVAIKRTLERHDEIDLIGEADDSIRALTLLKSNPAQVVIFETSLPGKDPLELIRELVQLKPEPKLLVLSSESTSHYAFRVLRAGASGFLSTHAAPSEVVDAVGAIANNHIYLPASVQETLTKKYLRHNEPQLPEDLLSDREFQVMRLLARGLTNREIASKLFIGVKTVDTHRANMLRKLNLRHNVDVVRFAIQNGFVQVSSLGPES